MRLARCVRLAYERDAMEADRYQQNHKLFIIGLLSLVSSLLLLFFSLFLLPHLLLGWNYDVPEFIAYWREWITEQFAISEVWASRIIFMFFIFISIILGLIAHIASSRIEKQIYPDETPETSVKPEYRVEEEIPPKIFNKESMPVYLHVLGVVFLAAAAAFLVHWFVSTPP